MPRFRTGWLVHKDIVMWLLSFLCLAKGTLKGSTHHLLLGVCCFVVKANIVREHRNTKSKGASTVAGRQSLASHLPFDASWSLSTAYYITSWRCWRFCSNLALYRARARYVSLFVSFALSLPRPCATNTIRMYVLRIMYYVFRTRCAEGGMPSICT